MSRLTLVTKKELEELGNRPNTFAVDGPTILEGSEVKPGMFLIQVNPEELAYNAVYIHDNLGEELQFWIAERGDGDDEYVNMVAVQVLAAKFPELLNKLTSNDDSDTAPVVESGE